MIDRMTTKVLSSRPRIKCSETNKWSLISGIQNDLQLYQYRDQYLADNGVQIHLLPIKGYQKLYQNKLLCILLTDISVSVGNTSGILSCRTNEALLIKGKHNIILTNK